MKKITLGLGALALVLGLTAISANSVFAYRGDSTVQGPNYSTGRHTEMEKAFADNDYSVWKDLMQNRGRVTQIVTEENFANFAEAHELMEAGNTEEAKKIHQEIGLGLKNGSGRNGGGMVMSRNCNR